MKLSQVAFQYVTRVSTKSRGFYDTLSLMRNSNEYSDYS